MVICLTAEQAAALRDVVKREIRDLTADARINGFAPAPQLAPLRELFIELHNQLKGMNA